MFLEHRTVLFVTMAFEAFIHFGPLFSRKTEEKMFVQTILNCSQIYMRPKLCELVPRDLNNLSRDLMDWFEKDSEKREFVAQNILNLRSCEIFSIDVPRIVGNCTKYSELNVDEIPNSGRIVCDEIYSMVKYEIANGNKVYFRKYHHLICFKFCKSIEECIRLREKWNKKYNVSRF